MFPRQIPRSISQRISSPRFRFRRRRAGHDPRRRLKFQSSAFNCSLGSFRRRGIRGFALRLALSASKTVWSSAPGRCGARSCRTEKCGGGRTQACFRKNVSWWPVLWWAAGYDAVRRRTRVGGWVTLALLSAARTEPAGPAADSTLAKPEDACAVRAWYARSFRIALRDAIGFEVDSRENEALARE